ncbi:BgTH12-01505 [Blumeria graminis f. sp. triticale]|uniref:BgTH12-01505 n=1 Tax=Blumeria graminis f. sp. triticale TaxID=1689686 RepID=A0A9W4CZ58_BLUGR|nr:BgTH12-01505 [Blumeria graminis f. sp. triticale]
MAHKRTYTPYVIHYNIHNIL